MDIRKEFNKKSQLPVKTGKVHHIKLIFQTDEEVEYSICGNTEGPFVTKMVFLTMLKNARNHAAVPGVFSDLCKHCIRYTNSDRRNMSVVRLQSELSIQKYLKKYELLKAVKI